MLSPSNLEKSLPITCPMSPGPIPGPIHSPWFIMSMPNLRRTPGSAPVPASRPQRTRLRLHSMPPPMWKAQSYFGGFLPKFPFLMGIEQWPACNIGSGQVSCRFVCVQVQLCAHRSSRAHSADPQGNPNPFVSRNSP